MIQSVIKPLQPNNPVWKQGEAVTGTGYPAKAYYHPRLQLFVISAVEVAEEEIGPEYHLSISKSSLGSQPRRCSAEEARLVVKQFGAEGATEDNHTSIIRNYWMPVNESLIGMECDCKDQEAVIREGDFEWRPLTKGNVERAKALQAATNTGE